MGDRMVVTGYGVKSAGGENKGELLNTLLTGKPAFDVFEGFAPNEKKIALGFVHGSLGKWDSKEYRFVPRFAKLALCATQEALEELEGEFDKRKCGVFVGTSLGGSMELESIMNETYLRNYKNIPSYANGQANYHSAASAINHYFEVEGISKTVSTGCTAGIDALQDAIVYIRSGLIDRAIVVGTDRAICSSLAYSFAKTRSVPLENAIDFCGLPFSLDSKGFVVSEGACTVLIEKETAALKRRAKIYGYIDDIFSNNDLHNVNGMDLSGSMMLKTMEEVSKGRTPDYISSQALGNTANDRVEYINSRKLFHHTVPLTTIKGLMGHSFASSGLVQLASVLHSFDYQFIPGVFRTNLRGYEDLNIQLESQENKEVKEVLITSHGYGGNNSSVYVTKN